jgi:hypothetical protein
MAPSGVATAAVSFDSTSGVPPLLQAVGLIGGVVTGGVVTGGGVTGGGVTVEGGAGVGVAGVAGVVEVPSAPPAAAGAGVAAGGVAAAGGGVVVDVFVAVPSVWSWPEESSAGGGGCP